MPEETGEIPKEYTPEQIKEFEKTRLGEESALDAAERLKKEVADTRADEGSSAYEGPIRRTEYRDAAESLNKKEAQEAYDKAVEELGPEAKTKVSETIKLARDLTEDTWKAEYKAWGLNLPEVSQAIDEINLKIIEGLRDSGLLSQGAIAEHLEGHPEDRANIQTIVDKELRLIFTNYKFHKEQQENQAAQE